jgi:hypothetical protein
LHKITIRLGKVPTYLKENPGAPFILVFILALVVIAIIYSYDRALADELATNAFYFLVVGVLLQVIAVARQKRTNDANSEADA